MKIERISEDQIRCTVEKSDLDARSLKLSELAYGTNRAIELFRDMMQQASVDVGFEVDDSPLVIEAIPVSMESLVLIVTKIDDPEELSSSYSHYTTPMNGKITKEQLEDAMDQQDLMMSDYNGFNPHEDDAESEEDEDDEDEDNVVSKSSSTTPTYENTFHLLEDILGDIEKRGAIPDFNANDFRETATGKTGKESSKSSNGSGFSIFMFPDLDQVFAAASVFHGRDSVKNSLYRYETRYYLTVSAKGISNDVYTSVIKALTEYGQRTRNNYASLSFVKDHFTLIREPYAMQDIGNL